MIKYAVKDTKSDIKHSLIIIVPNNSIGGVGWAWPFYERRLGINPMTPTSTDVWLIIRIRDSSGLRQWGQILPLSLSPSNFRGAYPLSPFSTSPFFYIPPVLCSFYSLSTSFIPFLPSIPRWLRQSPLVDEGPVVSPAREFSKFSMRISRFSCNLASGICGSSCTISSEIVPKMSVLSGA